jgi:SAM-dependent methyltransferase
MELPIDTTQVIEYRCNICGIKNRLESQLFHRELAACRKCGANARFRGIIHVLASLFGQDENISLQEWPILKNVYGIGMSDWSGYANLLRKKFSYQNTYYDHEPRLDIMNLNENRLGKYDFVISSDVFEHILQPIQQGFDNLFHLLKPGGNLIFSVPYTRAEKTVEHYPDLHDYEILVFRGEKIIVNRDQTGQLQVYRNPVFHGGNGATLEMRIFCESDILNRLVQSGFENIKVYDRPNLPIGYYWPPLRSANPNMPLLYAYIISARRPTKS